MLRIHWNFCVEVPCMEYLSFTVRIILTNFITYVKILCNLRHFYNNLDIHCKISWISHSHMKKLWLARGSNWRPLDLKSNTLPVSYYIRSFACKRNWLGMGLKLDNFHNFMNSDMQSSVAQWVVGSNHCAANFFKCEHYLLQRLSRSL